MAVLRGIGTKLRRRRILFGVLGAAGLFFLGDAIYLALIWPDWQALKSGPVPKSRFIAAYEARQQSDRSLRKLAWHPVAGSELPAELRHAVIVAEDASFYQHDGLDLQAVGDAVDYNLSRGKIKVGASTISQQTVKNLFLSSARTPLRKWHELILTWGMEQNLSKERILTLYLNIAELGEGIFGADAFARVYFGSQASSLTLDQCVALAASLPSPLRHNPITATEFFKKRKQKIYGFLTERNWGTSPAAEDGIDTGE